MSDNYQRVASVRGGDLEYYEIADNRGVLKVVPADSIVIERRELAAVDEAPRLAKAGIVPDGTLIAVISQDGQPLEHLYWTPGQRDPRLIARLYLSIAEYLDAHPPIDEAQVNQMLADISVAYSSESGTPRAKVLARRLVEQGWTKPEVRP